MKEARFEYKCRRCGLIDDSTCTAVERAQTVLILAAWGVDTGPGVPVKMVDVHGCKDGGLGISDLIGYSIVETG